MAVTAPVRAGIADRDAQKLADAKRALVKAGEESVRAAWKFGKEIDRLLGRGYTREEIAVHVGLKVGSTYRYTRFAGTYQRVELAITASRVLHTYDVGRLTELAGQIVPVERRGLAGRHWELTCRACGSHEVGRDEIIADED